MFKKIIAWLTEYFDSIENAYLYTDDFVNGTHESFFDGDERIRQGNK